jgi:hydroxymethylpyrimidine/phosphomethylpyrimidine kinase
MPKTTYGTHNAETLAALVGDLEKAVDGLKSVKDSMEQMGMESVVVSGQTEMTRAMERLDIFVSNAEKAVKSRKREMGHYGKEFDNDGPSAGRKKGRSKAG